MKKIMPFTILFACTFTLLSAAEVDYPVAKVDFQSYKNLVEEVEDHRAKRLIDLNTFLEMSKKEGVIIMDTRSKFRFDRIHVKGALHLNFSDFTAQNLAALIPSYETTILIYCNNNFEGNQRDFATKMAPAMIPGNLNPELTPTTQFASQVKPRMMALNVPTYLNLYGYGYRNVYELHELVEVNDPRISFEGSVVEKNNEK